MTVDHNWGFSIPPPFVNISHTSGNWEGLDNAAWGSHVYYSTVAQYDKIRKGKGDTWGDKPMTLTKFGLPDWRPGMDPVMHQESPAMHRYPVWWTGDGVPLQGSVESMVDSGNHHRHIDQVACNSGISCSLHWLIAMVAGRRPRLQDVRALGLRRRLPPEGGGRPAALDGALRIRHDLSLPRLRPPPLAVRRRRDRHHPPVPQRALQAQPVACRRRPEVGDHRHAFRHTLRPHLAR